MLDGVPVLEMKVVLVTVISVMLSSVNQVQQARCHVFVRVGWCGGSRSGAEARGAVGRGSSGAERVETGVALGKFTAPGGTGSLGREGCCLPDIQLSGRNGEAEEPKAKDADEDGSCHGECRGPNDDSKTQRSCVETIILAVHNSYIPSRES